MRTRLAIPQRNFLEKNFITFVSASSDAAICRYIDCYSPVEDNLSFLGIYGYVGGMWVSSPSNLAFFGISRPVFHQFLGHFSVIFGWKFRFLTRITAKCSFISCLVTA